MSELIEIAIRHDGLRLDPRRTRVVLIEALDRLLAGFAPRASHYAEQTLRARGVNVRLGARVAEVSPSGAHLVDGEQITAAAVVWVAGITVGGTFASTVPGDPGPGGRVKVESDLSLPGHPEVFIAGDAAAVPVCSGSHPEGARARGGLGIVDDVILCPQVAQVAIQSGRHVAEQILNRIADYPTVAFVYRDKGMMATIGRRAGVVAQLHRGFVLRGTAGWLAWLGLHLIYLIGFRNRLLVLVSWAWRYFNWPSGQRLIVDDIEQGPGTQQRSQR